MPDKMSKSVHVSDPDQTCSRSETNIYNLDFRRSSSDGLGEDPVSGFIETKCCLVETLQKFQDQSPSNTISTQVGLTLRLLCFNFLCNYEIIVATLRPRPMTCLKQ